MTHKLIQQLSVFTLILALMFGVTLQTAFAHNGVDHSAESSSHATIAQLEQMVALLTQVVELYKKKIELAGITIAEDDHHEDDSDSELAVWVEIHSNSLTHAHVQQAGAEEESFLLEDLEYTEEEAIIEAIAEETGLSVHDIEAVIVFPSGEVDEHGDSVEEHDEHADEDVSGIHIMGDGTIMWGNGTEVHGATITADGKVQLSDGRIITPKFDLR